MRDNDEGAALETARIENSKDDESIDGNQSDSNDKHESQDSSLVSTKFEAEYKTEYSPVSSAFIKVCLAMDPE